MRRLERMLGRAYDSDADMLNAADKAVHGVMCIKVLGGSKRRYAVSATDQGQHQDAIPRGRARGRGVQRRCGSHDQRGRRADGSVTASTTTLRFCSQQVDDRHANFRAGHRGVANESSESIHGAGSALETGREGMKNS